MDKVPLTIKGYAALEEELKQRQQVERPRIIQAISDARALGDLSENAEYHAAKEAQSLNEGRILELESLISRAEVIDVTKLSGDRIKFGATVKLFDEDTEEEKTYQIVGEPEADVRSGRVSVTSPIARALMGKTVGRHRRGRRRRAAASPTRSWASISSRNGGPGWAQVREPSCKCEFRDRHHCARTGAAMVPERRLAMPHPSRRAFVTGATAVAGNPAIARQGAGAPRLLVRFGRRQPPARDRRGPLRGYRAGRHDRRAQPPLSPAGSAHVGRGSSCGSRRSS